MRETLVCLVLLSVTIAATTALYDSGRALATEAEGYKSTLLALGHFREVEVTHTFTSGQKVARTIGLAVTATDKRTVGAGAVQSEQFRAWRKHRLAHAPWSQPDHRHCGNGDGL